MAGAPSVAATFGAAALFAGAALAQCAWMTWGAWTWRQARAALILGPVALALCVLRFGDDPLLGVLVFMVAALGGMSLAFRDRVLERADEAALLAFTLALWAQATASGAFAGPWGLALGAALGVPTLLVFVLCFLHRPIHRAGRIAAYLWFLVLVVALGAATLSYGALAFFLGHGQVAPPAPGLLVVAGLAFSYVVGHAWFLWEAVRPPRKGQPWRERRAEWRALVGDLGARFDTDRAGPWHLLAIVAGFTFLMVAGAFWPPLAPQAWVPLWVLLVPQASAALLRRRPNTAAAGQPVETQ